MKRWHFIFIFSVLSAATSIFAQRYWISTTGGAWSNAANWSTVSGGAGGAGAPVAATAIFDGAGGAVGNCSLDVAVTVTNFSVLAAYTGSIVQGAGQVNISGNSVWSGGAFSGGSSNIVHAGFFTLSGTNFRSTSGTFSVGNTFNFSSGTFVHNSGTTHFHSNSFAVNGACNFFHLKFSSGSNGFTINSPLLASGNLTLDATSGTSMDLNIGVAATMTVSGTVICNGSGLIRCNTGTIIALGDVGISNTSTSGGGTGTFKIAGTGNQLLSSSATIKRGRLPNVIIDKPSGTLSLAGIITIIGPAWTYSSGILAPGSSTVYFQRLAGGNNIVVSGTHTLNDVVFYPEYSISHVVNALTVNNLTIDGSQDHDVNVSGSLVVNGTLSINGTERVFLNTGVINAKGDISVTNTSPSGGGTGTININGTGDQVFSGPGVLGQGRVPNVVINKTTGTLSLSGNITTVGPGWTYLSGTINPGSSTVYLYRNSTNITVAGTHTLNNLFINHPSYATTIINNDLSVNSVTVDGSTQHNLSINSNLTVNGNLNITGTDAVVINTGTVYVKGNITNSNTHSGSGGTSAFIINGTSNQNLTGTGLANQSKLPPNIFLNKPSGQLVISGGLPYYLYGSFNFGQGTVVTTSTQLLIFGAGSSVAGSPGNLAYVDGPVRKIGNTAFTFPLGRAGRYAPIGISAPTGATSAFTASYFDSDPDASYNTSLKDASLNHISRCEYWDLQRTTGTSNVSVTVSWDSPRSCGVNNLPDLRVAHWDVNLATPIWKDLGIGPTTGNTSSGTIRTASLVSSFSPFTLASVSSFNPLPIELISFKARCQDSKTLLEWTTATEIRNNYFTVERSVDAGAWEEVAVLQGKGNSNVMNHYSYPDDPVPTGGLYYYRLKQTDFNGDSKNSRIVAVQDCNSNFPNTMAIYPNPSNGIFILETKKINDEIRIYDYKGQLIWKNLVNDKKTTIDISDYSPGIYFILQGSTGQKRLLSVVGK